MEEPADGRTPFMKPTEPFTSMSQVYNEFQKVFPKCTLELVDYKTGEQSIDSVELHIRKKEWPWKRQKSMEQFNQINDRVTQTYVMSAAWLECHDGYSWVKERPVFEDIGFPKRMSALLKSGPEKPEDDELDLSQLTEDDIDFERAINEIPVSLGRSP